MTPRRSKWRAYLLLSRISNLPTVWSNVIAGAVVSGAAFVPFDLGRLAAGVSFLYTAGMFLNDVYDREFDATHRPDRPIPAGDVSSKSAARVVALMFAVGLFLISSLSGNLVPRLWAAGLVGVIVYYNWRHKRDPLGPLWMGVCRGLVYCIAAAAVGSVSGRVIAAAVVMTAYVVFLTQVAKRLGQRASVAVPLLIAGISIVDAAIIAVAGGGVPLVLIAVVCAVLTLGFQRVVPGT